MQELEILCGLQKVRRCSIVDAVDIAIRGSSKVEIVEDMKEYIQESSSMSAKFVESHFIVQTTLKTMKKLTFGRRTAFHSS